VKLLDVFVHCVIGFEDVVAKVADEFRGSIRYGGRLCKRVQEVIEVAQMIL